MFGLLILSLLFCLLGMAKVTGPLFSISATGKIADAMVHFPWKGLQIVREWKTPTQPRPPAVMNLRIKMKALGKLSKLFSATSTLREDIIARTPAGSVWNADWIGVAIKEFQVDNAAYDTLEVDLGNSAATGAVWNTKALALGLTSQELTVEGKSSDHPASYGAPMALYSLAKACWYRQVLDAGDVAYTNPALWNEAAVETFQARVTD